MSHVISVAVYPAGDPEGLHLLIESNKSWKSTVARTVGFFQNLQ